METAKQAWQTLHQHLPELSKTWKISGMMALYKMHPQMVYRAGMIVWNLFKVRSDRFIFELAASLWSGV